MKSIYDRIQEAFGITNSAEIARKLGYGKHLAYKWRDGEALPTTETVIKVYELTGVSLHWLLTGEGEKYSTSAVTNVTKSIASETDSIDTAEGDWKLFSSLVNGRLQIRLQRDDVEVSYTIASMTHDFTK